MGFTNRFRGKSHLGSSITGPRGMIFFGTTTGIVARAGGGQSLATPLLSMVNVVSTAATAGDSVLLKVFGDVGACQQVFNTGAASVNVFPPTGGKINNQSVNAPFAVAAGKNCEFSCVDQVNNLWFAILSA